MILQKIRSRIFLSVVLAALLVVGVAGSSMLPHYLAQLAQRSTGFYPRSIGNAAVFNDNDTDFMDWTPGGSGDQKTWTFSFWYKRGNITSQQCIFSSYDSGDGDSVRVEFTAADKLRVYATGYAAGNFDYLTTQLFRDPTNWGHIVVALDAANTQLRIWHNGTLISAFDTSTAPANQNYDVNNAMPKTLGRDDVGDNNYFDGYLAEVISVDGTEYTMDDFGESKNGVWVPKTSIGVTYGTYGFYLPFSTSGVASPGSDLGMDDSGNNNDFDADAGGSVAQVTDSPTNNWCTLNPVGKMSYGSKYAQPTYTYGNCKLTGSTSTYHMSLGEEVPTFGKWYFEFKTTGWSADETAIVGWDRLDNTNDLSGVGIQELYINTANHYVYNNGATTFTDTTNPADANIYQVAIDADNNKVWFGIDDTWYDSAGGSTGDPAAGSNAVLTSILSPARFRFLTYDDMVIELNFGNPTFTITSGNTDDNGYGNFEYAPPTGFLALNSANIASSLTILDSIDQPAEAVYVNTRTGTGAEATISDVLFDVSAGAMVTIKNRDQADEWVVTDTVRGATKELNYDSTNAESTDAQGVKSFSSTGYVLGTSNNYNVNTENFLDWVVREGAAYGFDIVTYTGTGSAHTESHSLGVVPSMYIVKERDQAIYHWGVYHSLAASDPETDYAYLSTNAAFADGNTFWNDTAPTSSVFSVGTTPVANENTKGYVAYLFADIPGLCKAFAFLGNGNADGPYIPLGFRAGAFFIKRATVGAANWMIYFNKFLNNSYNPVDTATYIDIPVTESVNSIWRTDVLSQGIKIIGTNSAVNNNAELYIGMAWAEQFGAYSNAR